ncbi:MAG: hypothetical protein PHG16_07080 [Lachnospiraceae bacterium]|nr:hypothetical protein [Lachnospiraceae bacterium]
MCKCIKITKSNFIKFLQDEAALYFPADKTFFTESDNGEEFFCSYFIRSVEYRASFTFVNDQPYISIAFRYATNCEFECFMVFPLTEAQILEYCESEPATKALTLRDIESCIFDKVCIYFYVDVHHTKTALLFSGLLKDLPNYMLDYAILFLHPRDDFLKISVTLLDDQVSNYCDINGKGDLYAEFIETKKVNI